MDRRLTTILVADAVAYSRLMGEDEEAALAELTACRALIDAQIESHEGRIFGSAGDSVIAEFASPVEAVRAALSSQEAVKARNTGKPEAGQMRFRFGVHLGDVMDQDGNLLGDGVNIAARLEALAPPDGIIMSKPVADQVLGKVDATFGYSGVHSLKNITKSVEIWTWPAEKSVKPMSRWGARQVGSLVAMAAVVLALAVYQLYPSHQEQALPTGPRILILPFENVSGDPADEYFSNGLTRDINALLAKFSNLFVLAPETGVAFGDNANCRKIRDEAGADYILGGTVQRSNEKIRVTTTFIDARTCLQLQAPGPFERDLNLASVLDVQLEIARQIASLVGSSDAPLFKTEMLQLIREKAPETLDAYECYMTAHWFYQTFALPEHRRARDCLLRTVREEPGFSLAWSRLAYNYLDSYKNSYDVDPNWAQLSEEAARNAIAADRDNPDAYYSLAVRSRLLGESMDVFHKYAQKAVELNPNDSWILADLGIFLAYSGDFENGIEWIARARALNPKLHPGFRNAEHLYAISKGDYEEAINVALSKGATSHHTLASLAACYALNGDKKRAEETVAKLKTKFPNFHKDPRAPYRARGMPDELIERIMEGLRLAGYEVPLEESGDGTY